MIIIRSEENYLFNILSNKVKPLIYNKALDDKYSYAKRVGKENFILYKIEK